MAKKNKSTDTKDILSEEINKNANIDRLEKDDWETREVYSTGFRNIDTNLAFRVYDDKGTEVNLVRGMLSGSWVTLSGVSGSGKTTLATQMIANMMRPFIKEDSFDNRVKLYIMDVENGFNQERFRGLTRFTHLQLTRHVDFSAGVTIEDFDRLMKKILKEKQDKSYKVDKKIGYQGHEVEIYPPTFILIDAISELVAEAHIDLDKDNTQRMAMTKGLLLQQLAQKYRWMFRKYNINIFAITHQSKAINMDNPMAKPIAQWKGIGNDVNINGGKAVQYATDIGIYIKKIEAKDKDRVKAMAGQAFANVATSIMQVVIFKNRQALDNLLFTLTFDDRGQFDALYSFIYDCMREKIIIASGPNRVIEGTDIKVRSQDMFDHFIKNENNFRTVLYEKYDESKAHILNSLARDEEENQRLDLVYDIMGE